MAGPDWEEADPVGDPGDADLQPPAPEVDAAPIPLDHDAPIWSEDAFTDALTPSPGTPGEGGGEGAFAAVTEMHPHPDPLPEHREREEEAFATAAVTDAIESIFTRLQADPYSFDFFQAVRRI